MVEEGRRNSCDSIKWRVFFRGMFATLEKSDCPVSVALTECLCSHCELVAVGLVIYNGGDHDFETTEYKECRSKGSKNDGMQS